jgi:hypothetical protein
MKEAKLINHVLFVSNRNNYQICLNIPKHETQSQTYTSVCSLTFCGLFIFTVGVYGIHEVSVYDIF